MADDQRVYFQNPLKIVTNRPGKIFWMYPRVTATLRDLKTALIWRLHMHKKLTSILALILTMALVTSVIGKSLAAHHSKDILDNRSTPNLGLKLDLNPQSLMEKYSEIEQTPGIGQDFSTEMTWELNDVLTDSVDFGWMKEFGSNSMPSMDQLAGLQIDASGNIYVTGTSDYDWLTIKYDATGALIWSQAYSESGMIDTYGEEILVDEAGNVYVTGYRWGPFIDSDIIVIKYDPSGTQEWMLEYDGDGLNNDFPTAITMSTDGSILVGGYSYNAELDADFLTVKISPAGTLLWDEMYNGSAFANDWVIEMAPGLDGSVYVAGVAGGEESNNDYAILKYDTSGANIWTAIIDGIMTADLLNAIAVDTAGSIYATGVSQYYDSYLDYYTIKLDSAGTEQWVVRQGVTGDGDSWASDVIVDDSLNVTVTGVSYGGFLGFDYVTVRYDTAGTNLWNARYSSLLTGGYDEATHLAIDGNHNIVVTGVVESDNGTDDIVSVKYDYTGTELWVNQYVGADAADNFPLQLELDSSGNIYLGCLALTDSQASDYSVVKLQADGSDDLDVEYDGPGTSRDVGSVIATDGESNVYIAGMVNYPDQTIDLTLIKYDTTGAMDWSIVYDGPAGGDELPNDIAIDSEGNVIVTGSSEGENSGKDIMTLKYSPEGDQLWVALYDGPRSDHDEGIVVKVGDDDQIYVGGYSSGEFTNHDYTTINYDASGNELWATRYVGPNYGTDEVADLVVDEDGSVYVTGHSFRMGFNIDYTTIKYDFLGFEEWVARHNGPTNGDDYATAIDLDRSGNVFVTGFTIGESVTADMTTIKYSPTGTELWVTEYDGADGYNDAGTHIAVDNRGGVAVSGLTQTIAGSMDFITVMYNSNGEQLWLNLFDGGMHGDDQLMSMVRDGTGAIYVVGQTLSELGSYDYQTIKYEENGAIAWMQDFSGPGYSYDVPQDIAVDARGTVWVTGTTHELLLGDSDWSKILTLQYLQPEYPVAVDLELPELFVLRQNYPNPFNPSTSISFDVPELTSVKLTVYDILGQEIANLENSRLSPGRYETSWNGINDRGQAVEAGLYFCRLTAGSYSQTIKMIYLK